MFTRCSGQRGGARGLPSDGREQVDHQQVDHDLRSVEQAALRHPEATEAQSVAGSQCLLTTTRAI